ncbi:hypothetical protein MAR_010535 [Mya arenaria]|uniref:Uncharacterized protein n=1 Tax=Mya arenaria TaxID=6604 RepID=A0ABY7E4T4_MYAAR|nr:hypothetical protein MAR_010535 [Mya arenaria]
MLALAFPVGTYVASTLAGRGCRGTGGAHNGDGHHHPTHIIITLLLTATQKQGGQNGSDDRLEQGGNNDNETLEQGGNNEKETLELGGNNDKETLELGGHNDRDNRLEQGGHNDRETTDWNREVTVIERRQIGTGWPLAGLAGHSRDLCPFMEIVLLLSEHAELSRGRDHTDVEFAIDHFHD